MIRNAKSLQGAKVLHFDTGEPLALLNLPIINPDTGIIEAFWVKPLAFGVRDAVILTHDIVEFKKHVYVKSESVMAEPTEIIRISEILSQERPFMNAPVRNEANDYYGRVVDLSFDTNTFALKQLYVEKAFLGLIRLDGRLFSWERILKVLQSGIIVDDRNEEKEVVIRDITEPAAS